MLVTHINTYSDPDSTERFAAGTEGQKKPH